MTQGSSTTEFAAFLAAHRPLAEVAALADGTVLDGWRVTAFLGRGGSGEVYRVEHVETGQVAALKVLMPRSDATSESRETARRRFIREAEFLAQNAYPFFPKFYAAGETNGNPFVVMELLDARPLPNRDRAVATFLQKVCTAVRTLHRRGLVHRDIKPANILWRANGEPVLIDLGLLKETVARAGHTGVSVTLMDGHAVGAGTPHYAAPEQFGGGAVSAATDIHALGVLIDDCFDGKPPRDWNRIVRRATSSLPEYRYRDVDDLMRAIRGRHVARILVWLGIAALTALAVGLWNRPTVSSAEVAAQFRDDPASAAGLRQAMDDAEGYDEPERWRALCENVVTNVTRKERAFAVTNDVEWSDGRVTHLVSWATREVTNEVAATVVRLNRQIQAFKRPIVLSNDREWFIVGPGTLDANVTGADTNALTNVRLDHCIFLNRTRKPPEQAALFYHLLGQAYLNFIDREPVTGAWGEMGDYTEVSDMRINALEFGGPATYKGLNEKRQSEMDAQLLRFAEEPW